MDPWVPCTWGVCRPSDTHFNPTGECLNGDAAVGVVNEVDHELLVELLAVVGIGFGQDVDQQARGWRSAR
jgi:hypothetical protein